MTSIVGRRTVENSVLAVVVCIALLMATLGLATSATVRATSNHAPSMGSSGVAVSNALVSHATRSHTYVVVPNGHDDTAGIQAAFNACTSLGRTCAVQLVKGTYHVAQITVSGFHGSFVGMGQGLTVIQALPNLPAPTVDPFWAALPGPTNPWPALFTFENGAFGISKMTLTEPYVNAVFPSWDAVDAGGLATDTALFTAIEVTGLHAFAAVDHVTVVGTSGDVAGTNIFNAITFEGSVLPPGWIDPIADLIPLTGSLSVTSSVFNSAESGPWVDVIADSEVMVCYNTLLNSLVPLGFLDASNSQLLFCGNREPSVSYGVGLLVEQSVYTANSPSTVYVVGNDFQVNDGANAVVLLDLGTVPSLSALVSANVFQTDTSCGCYVGTNPGYSVIVSQNLESLVVSGNTILGGGSAGAYVVGGPARVNGNAILGSYAGVWVDYAGQVSVTGNVIKNSGEYGIAVTDGSSNNLVAWNVVKISGVDDLYWDGTGTGNMWIGNVYGTSSPPGL
jgi:parallel beta-helix repeat protein